MAALYRSSSHGDVFGESGMAGELMDLYGSGPPTSREIEALAVRP